ncbi:hypothetical protein, partial [Hymenobacter antarcticus]|uniref:hypothetical protein n=1 Tax=Hymenobacter antarcticus TaxID=486270 RepID=UPI0031EF727E
AADFTHHGQFKGQTVVALTTPHTRLKLSFHDIFWESCQPISGPDKLLKKAPCQIGKGLFAAWQRLI